MTDQTISPLSPNPAALAFLQTRRSRPAKAIIAPAPDRMALETILTAAARTPDHGGLVPWRFVVMGKSALEAYAAGFQAAGERLGMAQADIDKPKGTYMASPLAVAVVFSPVAAAKVPEIEQQYSAGAVCLSLVNAALASGWAASWVSGWHSHDAQFVSEQLGVAAHEKVAGIIHIGTESSVPPERPRPDLASIVTWK